MGLQVNERMKVLPLSEPSPMFIERLPKVLFSSQMTNSTSLMGKHKTGDYWTLEIRYHDFGTLI
jgi:hypothetical protein